jgi:DNA gyrase subunit A
MAEELIHPASIVEETRRRYLTYALSVISSRALPDVRDGLKPVQRRILYCMHHELQLYADRRPAKCARIIGDVTGKFHPHGDDAAYEALVRMAQPWVMRVLLVDGYGNFGAVDGDPPAARRYTEAKLTAVADHLLGELRQRTVDMRPTYNNEFDEPVVLPAQFPNVLVNGAAGIAVGMATNIPPHNLGDTIRAAVHLIDHKDATVANLLDLLKGPDFPLGGKIVTDRRSLRKIYEDGQGTLRIQAEWTVERSGKKEKIVITSIPYGVNKGQLENAIGEIIAERKLPQLVDLTNETNEEEGLRIALEMKPDSDPNLIMAYLYRHTQLQENFAVNLTCLVPDEEGKPQPQRLGLKEILQHFLDFRFETVKRRFEYELEVLRKRIHILEGFKTIFNALDKAIKLIRESQGKADAAQKLMKAFDLDEIQTEAILDAQLYRIAQMEIKRILDELREKKKAAAEIEEVLASKRRLWGVVKAELLALADKYPEDGARSLRNRLKSLGNRRTTLAGGDESPEFNEEDFIIKENTNVVLTRDGWIKRVGRLAAVENTRVREGDAVIAVIPGNTLERVVFFADDGTAYTMRINEVPASSGYGEPIAKFFKLDDDVRLVGGATTDTRFIPDKIKPPTKEDPPGPYLLAVTEQGQTLRTPYAPYREASTRSGRMYARLNEGDRVVFAQVLGDEKSIMLASRDGHVIHFPVEEINILSGVGKGVMGIKLTDDDKCLGAALIANANSMLQVETSGGRTMEFTGRYETVSRGGKGFEAVKRSSFVRVIPPAIELVDWDVLEGKSGEKNGKQGKNGQGSLFE